MGFTICNNRLRPHLGIGSVRNVILFDRSLPDCRSALTWNSEVRLSNTVYLNHLEHSV